MSNTENGDSSRHRSSTLSPKPNAHDLPEPLEDEDCGYPEERSGIGAFLGLFRGGLMAPTQTTYEAIEYLLTAETKEERDELTKQWRDHKLEELNFIGVVSNTTHEGRSRLV